MVRFCSRFNVNIDSAKKNKIASELGFPNVLMDILFYRGLDTREKIEKYRFAGFNNLYDPYLLGDMKKAVARIETAIEMKEKICIYGDYDVDGVTAACILKRFLHARGNNPEIYIPDRHEEGYGLHAEAIEKIKQNGTNLIITVDCGITSVKEIEKSGALGMDVIITDHHECKSEIPKCVAILNPKLSPEIYPFRELAGVGVVAKLIQAMEGTSALDDYIDLIAIGTIADMVPLTDENRIFVREGLKKINREPSIGICALKQVAGLTGKQIKASQIAFGLAPRLNACGRLTTAHVAIGLLTTEDKEYAETLANEIDSINVTRQQQVEDIVLQVNDMVTMEPDMLKHRMLIFKGKWNEGVVGIAATRLATQFKKPVIVLAEKEDDVLVGSGRSIRGIHLFNVISSCEEHLLRFGGHAMAVGLKMYKTQLLNFHDILEQYLREQIDPDSFLPFEEYDTEIMPSDINLDLVKHCEILEPTGCGNPKPAFLMKSIQAKQPRVLGKNKTHLAFIAEQDGLLFDAIYFQGSKYADRIQSAILHDMIFYIEQNDYGNLPTVQCHVKALQPHDSFEDKLNLCNDEKIIRAYCQHICYNLKKPLETPLCVQKMGIDEAKEVLKAWLMQDVRGTLVVLSTLGGLAEFKWWITTNHIPSECMQIVDYDGFPASNNNTVLFGCAPGLDMGAFERIMFYDALEPIFIDKGKPKQKVICVECEQTFLWQQQMREKLWISRDVIKEVYHRLKHQRSCSDEMMPYQWEMAIHILHELEIVHINEQSRSITIVPNPFKKDLADSKIFRQFSRR